MILTQEHRSLALLKLLDNLRTNLEEKCVHFKCKIFIHFNGSQINDEISLKLSLFESIRINTFVSSSDTNLGVAGGRNHLIKLALKHEKNAYLSFIDDDCILPERFFDNLYLKLFKYQKYRVFTFNVFKYNEPKILDCWPYYQNKTDYAKDFETENFQGGASIIHNSVFNDIGFLWDELFYAHEEFEFSVRLSLADIRIMHVGSPHILHNHLSDQTSFRNHWRYYYSMRNRLMIIHKYYPFQMRHASFLIRIIVEIIGASKNYKSLMFSLKGLSAFLIMDKEIQRNNSRSSALFYHEVRLLKRILPWT